MSDENNNNLPPAIDDIPPLPTDEVKDEFPPMPESFEPKFHLLNL